MKRVLPSGVTDHGRDMLMLLGEELKQPLVSIAQLAELSDSDNHQLLSHARQALNTIDNMLLYQRLQSGQTQLQLEPVHVGNAMHDIAHKMEPIMKSAGCRTEVIVQHGLSTVHADKKVLMSALQSLWQVFIDRLDESSEVVCHAHRIRTGIRLSLYSNGVNIDNVHLARVNTLSVQPHNGLAGPATDLLTAQGMFELLGAQLTKSTRHHASGFGVTLPVSLQLQMV